MSGIENTQLTESILEYSANFDFEHKINLVLSAFFAVIELSYSTSLGCYPCINLLEMEVGV